jgi:hypothetical protein
MNSPQDTTRTTSRPGAQPGTPPQGGDAASRSAQQSRPSPDEGGRAQESRQASDPPDAVPGRQYQGSGVLNKSGRFGSSQGPEDLGETGSPDSAKKP